MIALHAIWTGGALRLWGESSARPRRAAPLRGRRPRRPKPRPHPFAADPSELRETAAALVADSSSAGPASGELCLVLPSGPEGPLASPELIGAGGAPGAKALAPWTVASLTIDPGRALDFLCDLPAPPPVGVAAGASLRYWSQASLLVLELLAGQLFVPEIEPRGKEHWATWRPVPAAGGAGDRVPLLAAAMPPICRAAVDADERGRPGPAPDSDAPPAPSALVEEFLRTTLDAACREGLRELDLAPPRRGRNRGQTKPAPVERWLEALRAGNPRVRGARRDLAPLATSLRGWTQGLEAGRDGGALRTCFRLEPPADDGAPANGKPSGSDSGRAASGGRSGSRSPTVDSSEWTVSFHLQARDDPSLLIDAARVWRERSDSLTYLRRRFENPQERLLADLGRACRVFPRLEESLRAAQPEALNLDTEAAHAFLREAAPLLEQSGFGVLVPSWWRKPSARLGLKLRVRPARSSHAEAVAGVGMESPLDFDWEVALGDERISMKDFERLARLKVALVKVRGQWMELRPEDVEAAMRMLREGRSGQMSLAEAMRLGLVSEASETGLPVVGVEAEGWVAPMLDAGARLERVRAPRAFRGRLRPYQTKGLSWLAFLDRLGLGACLADDMGLGKTIQLIALLLHERLGGATPGPTLVVCPMSVVGNWQREVERFAPSLDVMVHHGTERLSGAKFARQARKHDLTITTYGLVHRDLGHLRTLDWHRIVLDEAQNVKNPDAKQAQALRALQATRRVAMTGTPVENRLSELWSIMDFLNPGFLGSASAFRRNFALPIERYRDGERSERLRELVRPFVLRRLKTDRSVIKDLPDKLEMKVLCNLTAEQASLYEAVVKETIEAIDKAEGIERRGLVLATLMKLKQVCNHPAHFLGDGSSLRGRSGKLARLTEMLEEAVAEGDRALVFTQFREMGELLHAYLQQTLGRRVLFLHGGSGKKARDEMVASFQSDGEAPPVFLLSLKAGGVGLNLTAASHVFHFDRWWNPAVENQATDRAYRIGQRKDVQVHKYVCVGTLEERIDGMIERKRELAELVVGAGEGWVTEMSTDELRELFALSRDAVAEG